MEAIFLPCLVLGPVDFPPCNWHRPFFMPGFKQGTPLRFLAPHLKALGPNTFAVNFLRETKNIHALQKLLGHADLVETQRYAKYSDESTKEAFALFDGTVLDVDFQKPDSQSDS